MKLLRDRRANLWLRNAKGDLPLHEAAASGRRELVLWLLDQRPKHVNTTSNDGRSILHIAASNDYIDMCKVRIPMQPRLPRARTACVPVQADAPNGYNVNPLAGRRRGWNTCAECRFIKIHSKAATAKHCHVRLLQTFFRAAPRVCVCAGAAEHKQHMRLNSNHCM